MSNGNDSRVVYSTYWCGKEFNTTCGLYTYQTWKGYISVTDVPEAEGGQSVQCTDNASRTVEGSGLVSDHSASDLQAGFALIETCEREPRSNGQEWLVVQHRGKFMVTSVKP